MKISPVIVLFCVIVSALLGWYVHTEFGLAVESIRGTTGMRWGWTLGLHGYPHLVGGFIFIMTFFNTMLAAIVVGVVFSNQSDSGKFGSGCLVSIALLVYIYWGIFFLQGMLQYEYPWWYAVHHAYFMQLVFPVLIFVVTPYLFGLLFKK